MDPIIRGDEMLVPLSGTNIVLKKEDRTVDVWRLIQHIGWHEDDRPQFPSQRLSLAYYKSAFADMQHLVKKLNTVLTASKFWDVATLDDKQELLWHIVSRGEKVYKSVLEEPAFACEYIGKSCGFHSFMSTWV